MKKILFIIAVTLLLWVLSRHYSQERLRYYKFTPELWHEASATNLASRYYIGKYIADHRIMDKKTRAEVVAILGEGEPGKPPLSYDLGPDRESFFKVDNAWLEIQLDPHERVSRCFVRTD